MQNRGDTAPAPAVTDIFGEQIQVAGNWFHAERIFKRSASSFSIGDPVPELAGQVAPKKEKVPDEYVTSDLFRESGANVTDPRKVAEYAATMAGYGGWGDFPMVAGRIYAVDAEDVDRYEELAAQGIAHELAYSRPLTRADIGRRIVHLENGHHRSYAAAANGYDIPTYDMELEEQSFGAPKVLPLTAEEQTSAFLAAANATFEAAYASSGIEVSLYSNRAGEATLDALWSHMERGKGHAGRAMQLLCALADEHEITLNGMIHFLRYGELPGEPEEEATLRENLDEQGLDNEQLERWYAKFGFERAPGTYPDNPIIVRPVAPAPALVLSNTRGPTL